MGADRLAGHGWTRALGAAFFVAAALAVLPSSALGVILEPSTIDGPSPEVLEFGGIAIAADGSGGLVYTKEVAGVPHVFASRYVGNNWGPPIRVDGEGRFEATEPKIAADRKGRLLVVWVTPVATVEGKIRKGLMSASLGPGAGGFSPPLLVDPNVGQGVGVNPSVAGVAAGKAIVAYRVVTETAEPGLGAKFVQLRENDVLAEIRMARFAGDRWSRLGAVNRNPAASMRPPTATNGPQVGIGATGNAVVTWQEPDQSGNSRIWARRVFSSSTGPPVLASPETWEGEPVTGEADAWSLGVTQFDQARIVSRVEKGGNSPARVFLGTFEPNYKEGGPKLVGPSLVGTPTGAFGVPAVAAGGIGGGEGKMRIAFATEAEVQQLTTNGHEGVAPINGLAEPAPTPATEVATTVGAEGGGVTAYETTGLTGLPAVAIRQEFPGGEAQTGVVTGAAEGPVSQLSADTTEAGDALLGFRQGEPGQYEIVADRASAPPLDFAVTVPKQWVQPAKALLHWAAAPSTVGGVDYTVVIDGHAAEAKLSAENYLPPAAQLGTGIRQVRVIATDALGGQTISKAVELKVDGEPPTARVQVRGPRVTVRAEDGDSGMRHLICSFGDGTKRTGGKDACHHRYGRAGSYTVIARVSDKAGNQIARRLQVKVR